MIPSAAAEALCPRARGSASRRRCAWRDAPPSCARRASTWWTSAPASPTSLRRGSRSKPHAGRSPTDSPSTRPRRHPGSAPRAGRALPPRYGAPWSAAEIAISVGGKAALFEIALALLEEGDEVVMPTPGWVSFPEQVRSLRRPAVFVEPPRRRRLPHPRRAAAGRDHDRDPRHHPQLAVQPDRRMIAADDLRAIVEAAAARGMLVVSDETYERFVYDGGESASAPRSPPSFPRRSCSSARSRRPTP